MQKPQFINNGIYHIYNRGVEKRDLFLCDQDYFRFIHDLFEFNDQAPAGKFSKKPGGEKSEVELPKIEPRKLLVEILSFSLMPNHYHLLLRQKIDKGIIQFMQKLGTGYTNYFNQRYERVGGLFQGRFKAVHVDRQEYFEYLLYYIHFNCLDLIDSGWREGRLENYQKIIEFLKNYRWSSHLDYIGKKNFPSVTHREFLLQVLGGEKNYEMNVEKWISKISQYQDSEEFKIITIE